MSLDRISIKNQRSQLPDPIGAHFPARVQEKMHSGGTAKQPFMIIFTWERLIFLAFLACIVAAAVIMYMNLLLRTATTKILLMPEAFSLGHSARFDTSG